MTDIFARRLPVFIAGTTPDEWLPAVRDLPLSTFTDPNCDSHYIFGTGGSTSLVDLIGTDDLTLNASAPTYRAPDAMTDPGSLSTGDGGLNGLKTTLADSQIMSFFGVTKREATPTNVQIIAGSAAGTATGGTYVVRTANATEGSQGLQFRNRDNAVEAAPTGNSLIAVGDWFFWAIMNNDGTHSMYLGGVTTPLKTVTQTKTLSANTLAFGNAYFATAGNDQGVAIAEGGYKDGTAWDEATCLEMFKYAAWRQWTLYGRELYGTSKGIVL